MILDRHRVNVNDAMAVERFRYSNSEDDIMKLLIAGCHELDRLSLYGFTYTKFVRAVLHHYQDLKQIEAIIQGGARGIDYWAKIFAVSNGIPCGKQYEFRAEWSKYGRAAGPIRNKQMVYSLECSDHVLCFWDYDSHGTKSTIDLTKKRGLHLTIVDIRKEDLD